MPADLTITPSTSIHQQAETIRQPGYTYCRSQSTHPATPIPNATTSATILCSPRAPPPAAALAPVPIALALALLAATPDKLSVAVTLGWMSVVVGPATGVSVMLSDDEQVSVGRVLGLVPVCETVGVDVSEVGSVKPMAVSVVSVDSDSMGSETSAAAVVARARTRSVGGTAGRCILGVFGGSVGVLCVGQDDVWIVRVLA